MKNKMMWRFPWGYRESLLVVSALAFGGFLIQAASGPFNFYLLHRPVNYIICGLIVLLSFLGAAAKSNRLVNWLSSVHLAVALLVFLLLFSIIMGLTPQMKHPPSGGGWLPRLGFTQVTSSWPFVLIYFLTLASLGMATARRIRSAKAKPIFLLNHAGLWLVLAAGGLGAVDTEKHLMYVQEGQTEWRVYSDGQKVLELPLAIRLDDFIMEEYPARLAVIDRTTGRPLPEGRPEMRQIDPENPKTRLLGWNITVKDFLQQAVPAGAGKYQYSDMPAAVQAAQVTAQNQESKTIHFGWVSAGNNFLPVSSLTLDERRVLVMTRPEPRRFASKVKVYAQNGQEREATVEVNKPVRINGWLIYQYGYDNQAGRMSSYSSFELVYDPWLYMVYVGLAMWALGSLGLIWRGKPGRVLGKTS